MKRIIWLWLICFPLAAMAAEKVMLLGMAIHPSLANTSIVFTLSNKTVGKLKYAPDMKQVMIEFSNTYKSFNIQNAQLDGANVVSMSTEDDAHGQVRFVFKVKGPVKATVHFLQEKISGSARLQLDIVSSQSETRLHTKLHASLAPIVKKNVLAESHPASSTLPFAKKTRIFTVVIDPGHGGKDTGARGVNGIHEKNVVLGIAKKLADEINQSKNLRAVLTRTSDYYVPLRGRLKLARKGKADLFVAIHADAYFDASAMGASVYALSQHGATNEAARWLAKRDNYSELGGVELDALPDHSTMLRSVLIDLAQTATIQDSLRLGNKVLDALDRISSLHYTHVEQAPFMVLKSPDIPSILVETGFISNPSEALRLNDPDYQKKIAHALYQGVNKYVHKYAQKGE